MNKVSLLYIITFLSLILACYVLYKVWDNPKYRKSKQWLYTVITVMAPIVGLLLIWVDKPKQEKANK